jgi:ribonuclease Z
MITSIRIYLLGTGGSWPTPFRGTAGVAVRLDDEAVLFDCGEYTQVRLMKSTLSLMKIKKIFITHFHGDHFLGLPGLIQTMSLFGRKDPLEIYGPIGADAVISSLLSIGYYDLSFEVRIRELGTGGELDFGEYKVLYKKSSHVIPSLSYAIKEKDNFRFDENKILAKNIPKRLLEKIRKYGSIEYNGENVRIEDLSSSIRIGRKISYSGDTRKDPTLVELFKDSTVLIHEATGDSSIQEKVTQYGHSTGKEAAEIAKLSNVKKLILIHFSPRYNDVAPIINEAREVFNETYGSQDLDEIEVPI